jgi:hypothetical protein
VYGTTHVQHTKGWVILIPIGNLPNGKHSHAEGHGVIGALCNRDICVAYNIDFVHVVPHGHAIDSVKKVLKKQADVIAIKHGRVLREGHNVNAYDCDILPKLGLKHTITHITLANRIHIKTIKMVHAYSSNRFGQRQNERALNRNGGS